MSIRLFPHGDDEFEDSRKLATYLRRLKRSTGKGAGRYNVITTGKYSKLRPGDIVVFHKDNMFVGHGQLKFEMRLHRIPLKGDGQTYPAYVTFDPKTISVFAKPKGFEEIRRKTGLKVNRQATQFIRLDEYEAILGLR